MKILFLNQFYAPDPAATGQLAADAAEALARRGHEVHVLCSQGHYGGGRGRHPAEEVRQQVRIHRVGASGFGRANILGRAADYLSFYVQAWRRAMAMGRMDVCVALTTPPLIAALGAALSRRRGTALVHWVMDLYPEVLAACNVLDGDGLLYRAIARVSHGVYRRATRIVSLGEVMTRRLADAGADPARIVTIQNWVPGEVVRPVDPSRSAARRAWCRRGETSLMYSGNLGLGHDLESVLRAAALLGRRHPLRVLFVGRGPMRWKLESLTGALQLDRVDFHEPRALADLSDSLAAGDIHIVSQRRGTEGLLVPSKIYGVLAAGRPVVFIGPEDTEAADIVRRSGAGFCVPPEAPPALAQALEGLLDDPALRSTMAAAARAWYGEHLGMERSVRRLVRAIEGVGCRA